MTDETLSDWQRLHPLSPLVRGGARLGSLIFLLLLRLLFRSGDSAIDNYADLGIAVLAIVGFVINWLVTRWRIEGADLRIETGWLRRESQRYPLRQVQAIDIAQSGFARIFGLAELQLRLAGGGAAGKLACLTKTHATQLREELLTIGGHAKQKLESTESSPVDATWAAPVVVSQSAHWTQVLQVPSDRLIVSTLISPLTIIVALYVIIVVTALLVSGQGGGSAFASAVPFIFGVGAGMYRRINGHWNLVLRTSDQGLELTSGLVQTTTEILPKGRIQAVRIIEPLIWRPLGWCMVEASVAGKRARSENNSQSRSRRMLLPVGTTAEAYRVIGLVLPDINMTLTKPPKQARWKSPFSYHHLAMGKNASCVGATSGRLRRVSHWVPLDKVQSIRRTQGPVQRSLGLATVHLDTAGAKVFAAMKDRSVDEAWQQIEELPGECAIAREHARPGLISQT